jgi:hypothetical protein
MEASVELPGKCLPKRELGIKPSKVHTPED